MPPGRSGLVLGLLASVTAVVVAVFEEWWLIVVAVPAGWLRGGLLLRRWRAHTIPEMIASLALDEGWRASGWSSEERVQARMAAVAGHRPAMVRRARRLAVARAVDVGAKAVAVDRLDAVEARVRGVREERRRVQRRALAVPVLAAVGTGGVALAMASDLTPGPVLASPWNSGFAILVSAVTSCVLGVARAVPERP